MSREIRKVPADWVHPKDSNGQLQPMFNEYYGDVLEDYQKQKIQWVRGEHPSQKEYESAKGCTFSDWYGEAPDPAYYLPKKYTDAELTHIQLYETCTEGTPTSPVFRADQFEEICEYAAEHCTTFGYNKTSKENWMKMLGDGVVYHQDGNFIFM